MSYVIIRGSVCRGTFHPLSVRWMRDYDSDVSFEFHVLWDLSRKYLCVVAQSESVLGTY